MFKRLIKNIIPFALLLHISSCSSFGVSKSEMNGACGIIDEALNNDLDNLKNFVNLNYKLEKQKTIDLNENKVMAILSKNENQTCLKNLKDNIANWGKRDFTKALADCLFLSEKAYTDPQGKNFTTTPEKHNNEGTEYAQEYLNNKKNLFNNLAIIKDPDNTYFNNNNSYYHRYSNGTYKNDITNELDLSNIGGANLACARLIAVDLDKDKKELSYRIKYLPYIFRSGYSSNRNKMKLPNNDTATNLFNSLRFIDDYGFQDTNFRLNAPEGSDTNSHHTDSERALLLCLTENTPSSFPFEKPYKLANFVHKNTIDLCIQVRNQNEMCGNCQCFYTGRDKVDLNGRGGIFLERGEPDDPSGASHLNILSILDRMEKRKNGGTIKNKYNNSLFLATREGKGCFFSGTKHKIGNQVYDPKNIINGDAINKDDIAHGKYINAQNTYYSRREDKSHTAN